MYDSENQTMKKIQIAATAVGARLFRNNSALGWVGESRRITSRTTVTLNDGDVIVYKARPLHAGLCKGSSDLIGFRTLKITADMIGKSIAQFCAVEVKSETGKPTLEQISFLNILRDKGALSLLTRSVEDAVKELTREQI
jgi:hypothetical protein